MTEATVPNPTSSAARSPVVGAGDVAGSPGGCPISPPAVTADAEGGYVRKVADLDALARSPAPAGS